MFIKQMTLTPHEAKELKHLGFDVVFVRFLGWSKDLYNISVVWK